MTTTVAVNAPCSEWRRSLPDAAAICVRAATAAIARTGRNEDSTAIEVSVLLADDAMVRDLNMTYRGHDEPTNVLSFPSEDAPTDAGALTGPLLLGDIVLAYETVVREARLRGISVCDHAMHLVVHGALHLLGYDHIEDADAEAMEGLEVEILGQLGIDDPYNREPVAAAGT